MSELTAAVDQASTAPPPRWPRLFVVAVLLPSGIVGALVLSALATMDKAARHGVPVGVQPFAVAMLEVVSIAGTLLAIFAGTVRLRRHAMGAVVGASVVSLVAGWSAFGWFGALGPLSLVYLVHLAVGAWQELRTERRAQTVVDQPAPAVPDVPVVAPAPPAAEAGRPSSPRPVEPEPPRPGVVYRLWSASGELLYIGMSQRGPWLHDRLLAHRAGVWGDEINHETVEDFPTRDQALAAEALAIRAERPKHNIAHNGEARRERAIGPVHGPKSLLEAAREIVGREPEIGDRRLAEALDVTRHRARILLRELNSGLSVVGA